MRALHNGVPVGIKDQRSQTSDLRAQRASRALRLELARPVAVADRVRLPLAYENGLASTTQGTLYGFGDPKSQ